MNRAVKMLTTVVIAPEDNRHEAILAWAGILSPVQMEEIEDAPDGSLITLQIDMSARTSTISIFPEG